MIPVTIGAFNGARGCDRALIWSARSMGASRLAVLRDIVLPSALPEMLNGIRTALALSFVLLVSAELIVSREGLGYMIGFLGSGGSYDAMFAVVLTVAFLGFAADRCLSAAHEPDAGMAAVSGKAATARNGATMVTAPRALRAFGWSGVSWLVVILLAAGVGGPGAERRRHRLHAAAAQRRDRDHLPATRNPGDLFINLGLTLYRALTGFAIATAVGIVLGIAIARVGAVRWFFDPIISVGFPMPKIAFLPIVVLWFGFHDVSKIAMVVFDATFPVLTATIVATRAVEKELLWSARSMGASDREMLHEIVLPAALPEILTGLQVALPIALIVCIVAEMLTGGVGLGGAMITASRFANSPGVFAGIVEIAVVGYCLVKGMALLRRRLLAWHPEAQVPATV